MAGTTVLASDNDSLLIAEGRFATSAVSFTTGAAHAALGQALRIRLVNLNNNRLPDGSPAPGGNDVEVDFDNVRLNVSTVSEPMALSLLMLGLAGLRMSRRRVA